MNIVTKYSITLFWILLISVVVIAFLLLPRVMFITRIETTECYIHDTEIEGYYQDNSDGVDTTQDYYKIVVNSSWTYNDEHDFRDDLITVMAPIESKSSMVKFDTQNEAERYGEIIFPLNTVRKCYYYPNMYDTPSFRKYSPFRYEIYYFAQLLWLTVWGTLLCMGAAIRS